MDKTEWLCNKEEFFSTKTELLSFKITLPLVKLGMIDSRLVSSSLIFLGDTLFNIQLVTFLLLSNDSELIIGAKTKNFDNQNYLQNTFYPTKNHIIFLIFLQVLFLLDQAVAFQPLHVLIFQQNLLSLNC